MNKIIIKQGKNTKIGFIHHVNYFFILYKIRYGNLLSHLTIKISFNFSVEAESLPPKLSSRTPSEENIVLDIVKESLTLQSSQNKIQSPLTCTKNAVSGTDDNQSNKTKTNKEFPDVPIASDDDFVFTVPKNYFMSPYLAKDEILERFPRTKILSTIVDPCLDDCIEFAKKLRALKVETEFDVLGALNHGFLNFAGVS